MKSLIARVKVQQMVTRENNNKFSVTFGHHQQEIKGSVKIEKKSTQNGQNPLIDKYTQLQQKPKNLKLKCFDR